MNQHPNPQDVLTLKGAAAQQTQWKGNLFFYQLCEERFPEFQSLQDKHPRRRQICLEIVQQVQSKGGNFLKHRTKTPMPLESALEKTKCRMYQIAKPKMSVPKNVSSHDVVFCPGAANHLFPGNRQWRLLLDEYFEEYWKHHDPQAGRKTPEQNAILEEIIDTVETKWGGSFRRGSGNYGKLSRPEVMVKTHQRMKDLRKEIRQQGKSLGERSYVVSRAGCTSTHQVQERKRKIKPPSLHRKQFKAAECHDNDEDDDDNNSFDSQMLSDNGEEEVEEDNDEWTISTRSSKLKQDQDRAERLERRGQVMPTSAPLKTPWPLKKRSRRIQSSVEVAPPATPDHEMSDYERSRYEKMKRNHERLVSLGLV